MRVLPLSLVLIIMAAVVVAQGPPPLRKHTANRAQPLRLLPATSQPPAAHREAWEVQGDQRVVEANGIPDHRVGQFPNRDNPNPIAEQRYRFALEASPEPSPVGSSTHLGDRPGAPNRPFGVALNGVLFDPGTAEFWNGDRELDWNYEALGGAVALGLDENHAHVQPNGAYHYHGLPTPYLRQLGVDKSKHSPLVGWAADGFPIYALYGYQDPGDPDSPIVRLTSSYELKEGRRPGGADGPGGSYDGAFSRDYEYVEGSGSLDECNGRFCVTPEFLEGTYAYFLTTEWPVIPRQFRGTPVELRGGGDGGRGGAGGPPDGGGRPPRDDDKGGRGDKGEKDKGKDKGGPPPR